MTVEYVAPEHGFTAILFRWKGSVYKLIWSRALVFILLYATISCVYRLVLNAEQQRHCRHVAEYFESRSSKIPLTFLVGFYVNFMVNRWWEQYNCIIWPDSFMIVVLSIIRGADEKSRTIRRTIARWINVMALLTWRKVCVRTRKRFPELKNLVDAGLLNEQEYEQVTSDAASNGEYFYPAVWCVNLIGDLKEEGAIDSIEKDRLVNEMNKLRGLCGSILSYDWLNIPLVYTQVTTLAVYGYFAFVILGRQPSESYVGQMKETGPGVDLYIPFVTLLEFLFYMGWLAVGEELWSPWGEDDEDFEMNWILDRNIKVGFVIADYGAKLRNPVTKDKFWDWNFKADELQLPHTRSSALIQESAPHGKFHKWKIPPEDMAIIPNSEQGSLTTKEQSLFDWQRSSGKNGRPVESQIRGSQVSLMVNARDGIPPLASVDHV